MHLDWLSLLWIISYATVILGLSGYGIHRYFMVYLYLKHARNKPAPDGKFAELPVVTVQLPIFNELHVVTRLVEAVAALDYPRDRLQIQILDDSTDATRAISEAETARLQELGFDVEHRHRTDRSGYKAGALEAGMNSAKGEFILILDADFVPTPELLRRMIDYFTDPKVGLIQARWGHLNRRYSLLTRIQAMFLDGHLFVEQTARSRSGRFFNFNGTAGIWRKSCIADAGGWSHDTLTEDLDLSYRAQMNGWKFIFLNDLEAPAELPVDMDGFKSQQHRWTKGSIQTCKKLLGPIWRSKLPLYIKLEATAHLTSNFAYLLLFGLCFLMYPGADSPLNLGPNRLLLIDLPVFFVATLSIGAFYACAQHGARPKTWWKEMIYLPCLLALGIGMSVNNAKAVLEAVFNRQSAFVRTPKYGIARQKDKGDLKKSSYRALRSAGLVVEILLAFYFVTLIAVAWSKGFWGSIPFLSLFAAGFSYVAIGSLPRLFQARSPHPAPEPLTNAI
ncbi:glycosyltransferase family 2 protein [soil metagenome]